MRKAMEMVKQNSSRIGGVILAGVLVGVLISLLGPVGYAQTTFNRAIAWASTGHLVFSDTAPTVASGFGTSPTIAANNGATVFTVNVGTGGSASAGVLTMPAATAGWACDVKNLTRQAANGADQATRQTATTTTTVTVQNQTLTTGVALAWTASDVLQLICAAY